VLLVSQIGTVISFVLLGIAGQVWLLFFARILDGITGGNIIVAQAYVTDITPREKRTEALGYIMATFGVGLIFGPAVGGVVADLLNYQAPYFLAAGAATIVVVLTWFMLEETVSPAMRAENKGKKAQGLTPHSVMTNMPLISILLMGFGAQFAFSMMQSTFSLFGEAVLFADTPDRVAIGVGILLAVLGVAQIFTQTVLIRQMVKRFGESPLVFIGGIIRSMSMFVLVLIAIPVSAGVSMFLFAVGMGMQMPALQSLVTNTVPDDQRGGVLGLHQSALNLGIIFGSAISGSLFEITASLPYLVGGIIFAIMCFPAFFLMRWAKRNEINQRDEIASPRIAPTGD
jgi:predicted MFS family arabinose efflux permease